MEELSTNTTGVQHDQQEQALFSQLYIYVIYIYINPSICGLLKFQGAHTRAEALAAGRVLDLDVFTNVSLLPFLGRGFPITSS